LKGAAGSFRDVDNKPSFTLNFDKHVKGQTFRGIERLSLNNSVQDQSYLNEKISREMFAQAGVPVPRASHATVVLNGRDLGLYVLTEAFNKQFLIQHFSSPDGNLYDGGFLADITDALEKSSGGNPDDRSDLKRLAAAAGESDLAARWSRLSEVLDLDRFVTYLALDVMICNWDGYALNRNNYRLYHDPESDKIVFMPHGLDQMFGVMRAGPNMPLFPRMSGLVARAVMQTPEGRQRYRERIQHLMTSVYQVEPLTNRVRTLAATLRPVLSERGAAAVTSHEREVQALCRRIVERARSIEDQLKAPDRALAFDTAGLAPITDWQSRVEYGKPLFDEATESGKKLLHVSAKNGSAVGVWVTRVRLQPGRYRLEGKVRTQGVTPDPGDRRGGAGLRIGGRRFVQKITGDSGWTDVAFDFEIGDGSTARGFMGPIEEETPDVELLCELRAAKGEAWFDRDSLRLLRK
jgi:hypothetical protein